MDWRHAPDGYSRIQSGCGARQRHTASPIANQGFWLRTGTSTSAGTPSITRGAMSANRAGQRFANTYAAPEVEFLPCAPTTRDDPESAIEKPNMSFGAASEAVSVACCDHVVPERTNT